jgi:hypothetical protein
VSKESIARKSRQILMTELALPVASPDGAFTARSSRMKKNMGTSEVGSLNRARGVREVSKGRKTSSKPQGKSLKYLVSQREMKLREGHTDRRNSNSQYC